MCKRTRTHTHTHTHTNSFLLTSYSNFLNLFCKENKCTRVNHPCTPCQRQEDGVQKPSMPMHWKQKSSWRNNRQAKSGLNRRLLVVTTGWTLYLFLHFLCWEQGKKKKEREDKEREKDNRVTEREREKEYVCVCAQVHGKDFQHCAHWLWQLLALRYFV